MPPCTGVPFPPPPGVQNPDYRNLVAALELRTAQAVFPRFERQNSSLHNVKTNFVKKLHNVSEGEDAVKIVLERFLHQVLNQPPPDSMGLSRFIHRQGPDFAQRRRIKMERPAAKQPSFAKHDREVADMLGKLELCPRQHHTFGGVSVDQLQNRRDVAHPRLPHFERPGRPSLLGEILRRDTADHAFCASAATSRVPTASLFRTLSTTPASAPGAITTCPTPCARAELAAVSFACMPPVAIPDAISCSHSAVVSCARIFLSASSTPSTSVRKIRRSAPNPAAHATAI